VVPFRFWLTTAFLSTAIFGSLLSTQIDAEEKGRHEEVEQNELHSSRSPKPKKSPTPKPKSRKNRSEKKEPTSATAEKVPTAIPHAKLAEEQLEEETDDSPKEKKSPAPKAKRVNKTDDEEQAEARASETPDRTPSSKTKRRHTPTPKPKSSKKKSKEKEVSSKTKQRNKTRSARKEEETPKPEKTPPASEERAVTSEAPTPSPKAVESAAPTQVPSSQSKAARSGSAGERAQVVVEKSGLEEDQGFEPPPSPPPRRGFWPWSRSSGNYRYLTRSVIDAIRRAPVKRRRWQFIVVHNSGTRQGNARVFDYYHRHVRRMQNGLAYHFVIGNGTSTGNGQVEVGDRWRRQINGGHVHSDYLNNISLGICLVGDFNRTQPTRAQLDSCEELIRYLRQRCGKTDKGTIPVRPHREMNPPRWATDCPGDDFPYSWFRKF